MTPGRQPAFWLVAALALGFALSGCTGGASLRGGLAYDRPGTQVKLADGRLINLRCMGVGSPTVILEAGFGATSEAWTKVQPQVAHATRVCAYDRAGYGFSDPGPLPRDGAAVARDLDAALKAAGVKGPYVLVGHSAGGLYARLFAARRLREVQGLVLLDPTIERRVPTPGVNDGLDGIRRRVRQCLANAEAPDRPDLDWSACMAQGSARQQALARRPEGWRSQLSELDTLFGRTSQETSRTYPLLKEMPAYILTASATGGPDPNNGWRRQHLALARTFVVAYQRTVNSSHLIMIDRPDVVTQAILEMVHAARERRPPAPLPPDEGPP